MNLVETTAALMVVAAALVGMSNAAVYKVGDSDGWTIIGKVDYKHWAANKKFHVGDIIHFEYNSQFHNVIRVTHAEYKSCNASKPIAAFSTGNDSVTISSRGHHYFICSVPGHCQAGQKVDINVPRLVSASAPTPSALPVDANNVLSSPSPSPSNTAPLKGFGGVFFMLSFAGLVACFV